MNNQSTQSDPNFSDMISLIKGSLTDPNYYESRKIAKTENETGKTIGVSTAWTDDCGYETALLDRNGVYPVERYESKEEAELGHGRWLKFSEDADGKKIMMLGYGQSLGDEEITLNV